MKFINFYKNAKYRFIKTLTMLLIEKLDQIDIIIT